MYFGDSVAETDDLLEAAKIETSTFDELIRDNVDLIPGTKGSGKSALFRIVTEFLPGVLFEHNRVVIAHGVQRHGDSVFHAFRDQFDKFDENQFVEFWCIYLISLAHEHFIKGKRYSDSLSSAKKEIKDFKEACFRARVPEIDKPKSLAEVLEWVIQVVKSNAPKLSYEMPDNTGTFALDLFGNPAGSNPDSSNKKDNKKITDGLPFYANEIKEKLEAILTKTNLSVWLMIDRLDEIFPRRSDLERKALRGLLRATRTFQSKRIRVKIFLRDDMLENLVSGEGFTALSHVTSRQADRLEWTTDQILALIIRRIFVNQKLKEFFDVDEEKLKKSKDYRVELFNKLFPPQVHGGPNQSSTINWIVSRLSDGRGVVTPRDVIDLLSKAKQHHCDDITSNSDGHTAHFFDSASIIYGLEEVSKKKRDTYLKAEFPHIWKYIEKFEGGKTGYTESALKKIIGSNHQEVTKDLMAIGFMAKKKKGGAYIYWIPYLYRKALDLSQGNE